MDLGDRGGAQEWIWRTETDTGMDLEIRDRHRNGFGGQKWVWGTREGDRNGSWRAGTDTQMDFGNR